MEPFNIIVGMTACGKTHCLLKILEKRKKGVFDYVILICFIFSWDKGCIEWKYVNDKDFITLECGQDQMDHLLGVVIDVFKGDHIG